MGRAIEKINFLKAAGLAAAFLCALSCGAPNVPLPPSLRLPRPVGDLRAVRKGDHVYLAWTSPQKTTDRRLIRGTSTVEICRSISSLPLQECGVPVGSLITPAPAANQKSVTSAKVQQEFADVLPDQRLQDDPLAKIGYAISVTNDRGRSAGLSNQAIVSAARTLPPPSEFRATMTAAGVSLTWTPGVANPNSASLHFYRIYRTARNSPPEVAGEAAIAESTFLDRNFEWEKDYSYRATLVTAPLTGDASLEVEGDDTPEVEVFTHDVFPPAQPGGLQAVFTQTGAQSFIDLIWTPNTEPDLAGYNLYRRTPTGAPEKLNGDLLKLPAYRDPQIVPGAQYFYTVTAVDVRGNESPKSIEAHEQSPER